MTFRVGYSYIYGYGTSYRDFPPQWYLDTITDYMERMLPAYISKTLNYDVAIESAPFSSATLGQYNYNWLDYLDALRRDVTAGYGAFVVMVDEPYSSVNPSCGCAGENYFQLDPNFAWTSIRNWQIVEQISRLTAMSREKVLQLGLPDNYGINALSTAGHELLHGVLLQIGRVDLSIEIDGGPLSGMVFLDGGYNVLPNATPDSSWSYVVQRVKQEQPCSVGLGAYHCGANDLLSMIFG